MTLHGYLKTQSSSAHHYIVHRFYANAKTNALDKENICVVAVVSMCRSRKIIYKRAVGGVSCRVVSCRIVLVLCFRTRCELSYRPLPSSPLISTIPQTANPPLNSSPPNRFFFALASYEPGPNIKLLTNEAGILDIGGASFAGMVRATGNAFIVFEVFNAGEGVFFVVVEF
jgi:hypothetical protein